MLLLKNSVKSDFSTGDLRLMGNDCKRFNKRLRIKYS